LTHGAGESVNTNTTSRQAPCLRGRQKESSAIRHDSYKPHSIILHNSCNTHSSVFIAIMEIFENILLYNRNMTYYKTNIIINLCNFSKDYKYVLLKMYGNRFTAYYIWDWNLRVSRHICRCLHLRILKWSYITYFINYLIKIVCKYT